MYQIERNLGLLFRSGYGGLLSFVSAGSVEIAFFFPKLKFGALKTDARTERGRQTVATSVLVYC